MDPVELALSALAVVLVLAFLAAVLRGKWRLTSQSDLWSSHLTVMPVRLDP